MRRNFVRFVSGFALLLTACTGTPQATPPVRREPNWDRDPRVRAAAEVVALRPFDGCEAVLDYFRDEAKKRVGPYGLPWDGGGMMLEGDVAVARGVAGMAAAVPEAAPSAGYAPVPGSTDAYSTTNVQERDVDEPDTVKTDGRRIFTMIGDRLVAVGIDDGELRTAGTRRIEGAWGSELLLAGDRLLVLSREGFGFAERGIAIEDARVGGAPAPSPVPDQWRGRTAIRVVDVRDPSRMRVVETLWVEGDYVSARMIGGIARIVLRTPGGVGIAMEYPTDGTAAAARTAERRNRRRIDATTLDDWLPRFAIADEKGVLASSVEPVVPCDRVRRPPEFGGLGMVSVLTVDPEDPKPQEAETVVGTGETVYASQTGLYVTTTKWGEVQTSAPSVAPDATVIAPPDPPRVTTQVHRFDISDPRRARYVASGEVRGTVLNQWSLSEHEGRLRIATTRQGATQVSEVTVLEQHGPLLERVGRVGGLGKNERIYAVRFMGDLAYVVTFRQVDPLYVLDLSDPTDPRVRGELKTPGFSAYLHPVDDGRLLGIGQDADRDGRALGVQASVFDVSDPTDPRQIDKIVLGQGHTTVQEDHRAFLWWAPSRTAVLPLWLSDNKGSSLSGAVALGIGRSGSIRDLGRIQHPRPDAKRGSGEPGATDLFVERPAIERALVVGETLYTVSQAGIMGSDLASLDRTGWLEFPLPETE